VSELISRISSEIDFGQYYLDALINYIAGKGVIPFVGAGLSIPLGYPGWTDFLNGQAEKLGIEKRVKRYLARGHYEEAAELLEDRGEVLFRNAIRDTFAFEREFVTRDAPVFVLPRIAPRGPIVTTNFDSVLERVYTAAGYAGSSFEFVQIGGHAESLVQNLDLRKHGLVKLHGDAQSDSGRVLTKREYQIHYCYNGNSRLNSAKPLPQALRWLFLRETLLFLGCSLDQDRLVKMLRRALGRDSVVKHFAIVEEPDSLESKIRRATRLQENNIQPIWYPAGRHTSLRDLLEYVADRAGNGFGPPSSRHRNVSAENGRVTVTEPIELSPGNPLELLSYLEGRRSEPDGPLAPLAGTKFDYLRPGYWNGKSLYVRVVTDDGSLRLRTYPELSGRDGKYAEVRISASPDAGESEYVYHPRGSLRPEFSMQIQPGQPATVTFGDQEVHPERQLRFIIRY
jgi:hypothetical protein